ncbi:MAG: uracil-DNA glycosylase [Armatimonadota bacterium]|nr:uracil-DNA glycosylase [Armatimonadota bacterium]
MNGDSASPPPSLVTPPEIAPTADDRTDRMEAVRLPCLQCTTCDLSLTRTQVVFGEGNIRSPLVIVGEGPGEQEDATGRPFVGRSGNLLDDVLRENGILRQHIRITNVVKCRACNVEGSRVQNRPPRVEEVEACRPWLQSELSIVAPLVILCLGGPSASWIIHPDFKVLRERGQWFQTTWAAVAMATLHPAYVLRQHGKAYDDARALLVGDIGAAKEKVKELRRGAGVQADPVAPPAPVGAAQVAEPEVGQGVLPL